MGIRLTVAGGTAAWVHAQRRSDAIGRTDGKMDVFLPLPLGAGCSAKEGRRKL